MWIGIANVIPSISNLPGQGGIPPLVGDFIEQESNLFLVELEDSTDLIKLEESI
tara:strand:- start:342 stop:503 length:162 start_codon:yes stop_codon:yes gene_type:complete